MSNNQAMVKAENIDESEVYKKLGIKAVEPSKAATARAIALTLVWTFVACLILSFCVAVFILYKSPSVDEKTVELSLEFLKACSTLLSPLLAFVLGFYFSKRDD